MVVGHAVDHFLDEDGLTHSGTTEQADLSTLNVGGEEVDRLDTGLEHLGLGLELVERRGVAVDGPALGDLECLAFLEVEDLTGHVEDVALGDVAHGNRNRRTGVVHERATDESVGRLERDRADHRVTQVLGDFHVQRERRLSLTLRGQVDVDLEQVVHLGESIRRELDVNDRTDDAGYAAHTGCSGALGT